MSLVQPQKAKPGNIPDVISPALQRCRRVGHRSSGRLGSNSSSHTRAGRRNGIGTRAARCSASRSCSRAGFRSRRRAGPWSRRRAGRCSRRRAGRCSCRRAGRCSRRRAGRCSRRRAGRCCGRDWRSPRNGRWHSMLFDVGEIHLAAHFNLHPGMGKDGVYCWPLPSSLTEHAQYQVNTLCTEMKTARKTRQSTYFTHSLQKWRQQDKRVSRLISSPKHRPWAHRFQNLTKLTFDWFCFKEKPVKCFQTS